MKLDMTAHQVGYIQYVHRSARNGVRAITGDTEAEQQLIQEHLDNLHEEITLTGVNPFDTTIIHHIDLTPQQWRAVTMSFDYAINYVYLRTDPASERLQLMLDYLNTYELAAKVEAAAYN